MKKRLLACVLAVFVLLAALPLSMFASAETVSTTICACDTLIGWTKVNAAANNPLSVTTVRAQAQSDDLNEVAAQIGGNYYLSSLVYLSGCTLRHYYTGSALDKNAFDGVKSDYYYYVETTDIAAADFDKLQEFTVGGTTFHWSALDFVKAIMSKYEPGTANYNLAAATYWYNNAVSSSISENTSLNNESKPKKNGGTVSSNPKSESKTNSETAVADGDENQSSISDSSAKGEVPPLDADEYELPFIPN